METGETPSRHLGCSIRAGSKDRAMTSRAQAISYVLLMAMAFGSGWFVNGWRLDARITKIELAHSTKENQKAQQVIDDMAGFQKGFNNALADFQRTQQGNAQAQQDLGRVLLDLRGTAAGLRVDFAGLPARIERASRASLAEYASACSSVFEAVAAGGGRLAEIGAGISSKAEGHAADAGMTQESWRR